MARARKLFDDGDLSIDSANAGAAEIARMRPLADIKTDPAFQALFPLDKGTVDGIAESIRERGYDRSQPVHVWKERGVLIDGHTRLAAARKAGAFEIPVYEHSFPDEGAAMLYAYSLQLDRRNLSDAELLDAVSKLAALGGKRGKGRLREILARRTGRSEATIARAIAVSKDAEAAESVRSGGESTNGAYQKLMQKRRGEKKADAGIPTESMQDEPDGVETEAASASYLSETEQAGHAMKTTERAEEARTYADGFRAGLTFAVSEMVRGRDAKSIWRDGRVRGLSDEKIGRLVLPDDAVRLVKEL